MIVPLIRAMLDSVARYKFTYVCMYVCVIGENTETVKAYFYYGCAALR